MNRVDHFHIVTVDRRDVPMFIIERTATCEDEWLAAMDFACGAAAKLDGLDCRVFVAQPGASGDWSVGPADSEGVGPFRLVQAPDAEMAVARAQLVADFDEMTGWQSHMAADDFEPF